MANPFDVELVTPERIVFNGQAQQLSVPGAAGSLGILANHAPLLTELKIGEAVLKEPSGAERHFYIGGGFLEVNKNHVTILAPEAIGEDDLDPAEAERLHRVAQENLALISDNEDGAAARLQAARAEARWKVVRRNR